MVKTLHTLTIMLILLGCENRANESRRQKNNPAIYYRELAQKSSWLEFPGGIAFHKTEVMMIDSLNRGFQFKDTTDAKNIATTILQKQKLLESHPNIAYLKDHGFVKLVKKELPNGEKYLVMSNDSSFIFVYRILRDSSDGSFSAELYGSHSSDTGNVAYAHHAKENEVYYFKQFK